MELNFVLEEELQNLDLDSDSSFTSRELAHFDREKLIELAYEKDQAFEEEKFNFISFNQLMGLEESDEDKHDQQDPKMKQKDQLFSTLNEMGMSISKMAQLDTLGLSESTIKRKRRQLKETRLIKRQPGSGRKKIIDEEKECFILEHLAGNPFLSKTKIATLLKAQFKDLEISEISIRRFLVQKGYKWKGPLQRVKNEVEQKTARLQF